MIVSCIFIGACLTWLVKKTGSVLPAALAHSAIDMFGGVAGAFVPTELAEGREMILGILIMIPVPAITAVICLIGSRKEKAAGQGAVPDP